MRTLRCQAEGMPKAPKTVPTETDVAEHLAGIQNAQRRADAQALCTLLTTWTGEPPVMWGPSIVGFGSYHFRYASGREGDWMKVGFAARKQGLVLYLAGFDDDQITRRLAELGPHSIGKGCLYLKRLGDVDQQVLGELVALTLEAERSPAP